MYTKVSFDKLQIERVECTDDIRDKLQNTGIMISNDSMEQESK